MSIEQTKLAKWLKACGDEGRPVEARLWSVGKLVRDGFFDEAAPFLDKLAQEPEVRAEAKRLRAVCGQLRRWGIQNQFSTFDGFEPEGTEWSEDPGSVIVSRCPGSRKCIVVFCGAARQIWVSVHVMHQILPSDCNVLYLKDNSGAGFVTGIKKFGPDFPSMVTGLGRLIRELGADDVRVIGSSAGGFASIAFGLAAEVERMLVFAPQTDITGILPLTSPGSGIAWDRSMLPRHLDLVTHYATLERHPPVTLVFGDRHTADAAASRRLKEMPGVRLHAIDGYDRHDVLAHCFATGEIRDLITELSEIRSVVH